jgi:hypothetical protein
LERVLVCILAQTRAHQVAWPTFKRQVLDELNADLALAITVDEAYDYANPYWQHAKYRWAGVQPADIGDSFDLAQQWLCSERGIAPPDWREMLGVRGIWQGGIRSRHPQPSYSANLLFCRWLLLQGLQQDRVLHSYDRYVVTRSDFVWLCPHPPLSILGRESLWVPDGEDYGGVTDRHLVVSREDLIPALSLIDDVLLRPTQLYEEMSHRDDWSPEVFLAFHLERHGLLPRLRRFPYVMYTARSVRDAPSTWSPGRFDPSVKHIVKYPSEFRSARAYGTVVRSRQDWIDGAWRQLDHAAAMRSYEPSRFQRYLTWPTRDLYWGLRRPGRVARIGRFLRGTVRRVLRPLRQT